VMGGQQAASVLSTIRRQQIEDGGGSWSAEDEAEFQAPVLEQFEAQGNPYYSTARLWDDGVIDPSRTREVLGLAIDVCMRAPMEDVGYGVFRM
jgi:3-methylcrotonyl-CoA carboxylase beta subunit